MKLVNSSYLKLPSCFYSFNRPSAYGRNCDILLFNDSLAKEIGLDDLEESQIKEIFSGKKIIKGTRPFSQVYAGHQFGCFNPQLGDGRVHNLGETCNRLEIQLKGSGPTLYSRRGDGLSALGPVLREYIVSEAMHALGVPTTRSLVALKTDQSVVRQNIEPAGILTRLGKSFVRIGTFEYFASIGELKNLNILLDHVMTRLYPNSQDCLEFFHQFVQKQCDLVTSWMSLGFIHGVMNTDNVSISSETLDYGPCAFMDHFKFNQSFSYVDQYGRYAYDQQCSILQWNIDRLAHALGCIFEYELLKKIVDQVPTIVDQFMIEKLGHKLGIEHPKYEDEKLISQWFKLMESMNLDFTLGFRNLANYVSDGKMLENNELWTNFEKNWRVRLNGRSKDLMNKVNPQIIPRNHLIEKSFSQDLSYLYKFHEALKNPYESRSECDEFVLPPKDEEKIKYTFCGT